MRSKHPSLPFCALIVFLLAAGPQPAAAAKPLTVSSPDGNLIVSFALKSNPQPYLSGDRAYYRVTYKGMTVLDDSPLGLDFLGARSMDKDFEVIGTAVISADSTWDNPFGAKRVVPDRYNQLTVSLREKRPPERRVDLVFRAYNEGLAFRYILPKQKPLEKFALSTENTGFHFAHGAYAYALNMGRFNTHNEGEYLPIRLDEIKPSSIINLPLLVETPGGPWVALLEADLTDYAGLYVGGVPGFANALIGKLSVPPRKESVARSITTAQNQAIEQPVVGTTPKATPWRVLLMADTPGRLIETNYLILNLNPPCALADPSWIKPGKAAWDWWSGSYAKNVPFKPGMNTATMKHYIEFAGAHHLEYMLIDGGWYAGTGNPATDDICKSIPEINIPEILAHAKSRGVKVLLWVEWRTLDRQLDEALALYEKWGVAGVKVDFMNRDDQEMVNLCAKWVRKAAEHHLVIDLHGAYKETGLRRTYPNLLTVEGVMGMEYNLWSERVTPDYNVTIPFTRMLAGPMDFTPGAFRNAARGKFKIQEVDPMSQGTRAHQLAMYVVYDAPLAMLADYPEAYEGQPGFEFIESVPTVWDETKVLSGAPGKSIVVARQRGEAWYLGAMTNWEPRDLTIPLGFLGPGIYEARLFADGPDAAGEGTSLSQETKQVKAGDSLTVHLAPGGGWAVILKPANR
jgi:alpha-glucosidase